MKRTLKLSSILLMAMLMLSSCFIEIGGGSYSGDDYLYVKGTAARNEETGAYEFASGRIFLNGNEEITAELEPVNPKALDGKGDVVDNVLFMYPTFSYSIEYGSKANKGYVFEEWKVRKLSDLVSSDDIKYETYNYRKALEGIEEAQRFLDTQSMNDKHIQNRYSENPDRFHYDILPYIYPEYNRAPVALVLVEKSSLTDDYTGNGTFEKPYTIDEFRKFNENRGEISAIARVKDSFANNDLSRFFTDLCNGEEYRNLDEVHISLAKRTSTNADIGTLLDRLDYVEIENVEFGNINLSDDSPTKWKFKNCHFNHLNITTAKEVVLENCTYDNLVTRGQTDIIRR